MEKFFIEISFLKILVNKSSNHLKEWDMYRSFLY